MKKIYVYSVSVLLILLCSFSNTVKSQNSGGGWTTDQGYSKVFIENKGQFPYVLSDNTIKDNILFAVDNGPVKIYFTSNGVIYNLIETKINEDLEAEFELEKGAGSYEEWEEREKKAKHKEYELEQVSYIWEGSNPDVEIVAEDASSDYYSYTFKSNNEFKNENYIKGYKKIIYKNLYENIDVEYTFHAVEGIKYALILHPGADISKINMKYSDPITLMSNGDLHISTIFGDIIDHAPETYYSENSSLTIKSSFTNTGNSIGFALENYDITKSVTIDPWVVSPTFTTSTAAWEVETDGSGNVYVIGGETPMQLKKYNSTGTLLWTYTTPWDTASVWLGTLATDDVGNSFITSGTAPEIERIDPSGGMVWHNNGSAISDEWWSITFNCDKTKLIVGGTILNMFAFEAFATIFDMDINNGNVLGSQNLAQTSLMGIGSNPIEVRSISSSMDAKYIFLTHNDVGAINQTIGLCPNGLPIFQLDNGHNLGYKCENYLPATQNGGGLKALVANDQFFYTHSGDEIHKRDLNNGALITTVSIPGGASSTVPIIGGLVVENSGLAVDDCGNVYAGSTNQVVKYDANLNILATAPTTFCVYDVSVNSNGEVLAVGAQSDNQATNRNGRIESINMSACAQFALVCCDANICPPDTVCSTDPAFNLTSSSSGGTWSGTGITNSSSGTFDPSVSGAGSFTVTYTQPCGSSSVTVQVNTCATLSICQETNGDLTVTGGTGPYNWEEIVPGTPTPITDQASCVACGYTWFVFQCMDGSMNPVTSCPGSGGWSSFGTGTTVTPPVGSDTIQVTDVNSNSQISYDISTLPMCTSCAMSASITGSTQPSCGLSDGSATASASGGTGPFTYNWSTTPAQTTQTATNLPAGTYTVTITDGAACTSTATVTLTNPNAPTVSINTVDANCGPTNGSATATPSGGTGPYTYNWNTTPPQNTQTATNLPPGPYSVTVTDALNCTGVQTCTILDNSAIITATISGSTPPSCGMSDGSATASGSGGTGPYTYSWNTTPPQNTATASGLPAGTYTVTVSDASSCTGTNTVILTNPNAPVLSTNSINANCGASNGSAIVSATGGTAPYTYQWNTVPPQTTQAANNLAPGTYYVTVTDQLNCSSIDSVTVVDSTSFTADAGSNMSVCEGDSINLTATGGTSYLWSTSDTTASIYVTPAVTTLFTVTVTDGACSATDTVTVTVNQMPVADITGDTIVCSGSPLTLTASGGSTYLWSTSDTTAAISVTPTGLTTYDVTVSNSGCTSTASISVDVAAQPAANAGNDTTINIGGSAQLDGSGGVSFSWSPSSTLSCSNCPDPVADPLETTTYVLLVTDAYGCTNQDTVTVTVDINCGEVFVPNAFSPDNNGQNELECVYGNCIVTIEFAIYDRLGEKVFETTDPKECWDGTYKGKELNTASFVYYLKATLLNGTEVERQGNISLFR